MSVSGGVTCEWWSGSGSESGGVVGVSDGGGVMVSGRDGE